MKILGINGLGVLPSACIIQDGELVAFAEEERFSRLKGSFGMMPLKASKFCLAQSGLSLEDIDHISFAWDCNKYLFRMPAFLTFKYLTKAPKFQQSSNLFSFIGEIIKYQPSKVKANIKEMFQSLGMAENIPPIQFTSHHLAHAASTFYFSQMEQSYILVIDGSGEDNSTSLYYGCKDKIELVNSIKVPNSLGWFYQSFTEFLGFQPNQHEGKLMGLAAYGNYDEIISKKLNKVLDLSNKTSYTYNAKFSFLGKHQNGRVFSKQLEELFGAPRKPGEPLTQAHKNLAFGVQEQLEKAVFQLIDSISALPNFNGQLCLAGGVSLNCKLNGKLYDHRKVKHLFVPPFSSDAGSCIGAALVLAQSNGDILSQNTILPYQGSAYTNEQIELELLRVGANYSKLKNSSLVAAQLIADNKTIAWFQGRMESGPRALGNRSILANPMNAEMQNHVNITVKSREKWRPFAASILEEFKHDYIINAKDSPFMAISFQVKEEAKKLIPAAIHIDGSTRPQFVKKEHNPKYWELINNFGEISGVYAVLNTSFNTNEEPLIENPIQAIKAFYGSGLDYLIIGDFIVNK